MMFVLMLILFVLLIATGLLPGAIRMVSAAIGILLALYIGATFGWIKLAYIAAAAALIVAFQLGYLEWQKKNSTKKERNEDQERKEKFENDRSAREAARRSEKEEAIARQVAMTDSIGEGKSKPQPSRS